MDVLILDEWLPSIRNSGKSIRTFELLAPLARKHRLTYLAHQTESASEISKMEEAGFRVLCVPRRPVYASAASIALGAVPALFDPLPISVRRHFSPDYTETIKRLIQKERFDLIHIEWSHYGVYGQALRKLGDIRIPQFACTHNVEYLSWSRFIKATSNPVKKLLGLHEAWKMYRFERNCYRQLDYLSTVSEEDARLVQDRMGIQDVCVIPNGVGIAQYDELSNNPIPDRLVYCGSMDAFINQDAVAWFIRTIFPLVLRERPNATFTVIGRDPPAWLLNMQSDRIRFTGAIADIRIPLKEAMLEVVPLRIAGGSRLKILEAFAANIPVLSTTIGAEGLQVEDGKHLVLADGPEQFANACIQLLNDPAALAGLVEQGRALVDEQYDWSRISPLVEQAWKHTVAKKA